MDNNKYSLTFPQKNIWLVEKFNPNNSINVIVGTVNINNGFSAELCDKAINELIKNNDAMRIKLYLNNNEVSQEVQKYKYEEINVIDFCSKKNVEVNNYLEKKASIHFEMLDDKLYEFEILKFSPSKGAIMMRIHHIISDAWSCSKIGTQLIDSMESILKEGQNPSYLEYINSEQEYINSDKHKNDEEFWSEYLKDIKDPVSIKSRSSNFSTSAKRYSVKLEEKMNTEILEFCKENKISVYTLFLAALATYIYRIKDEKDIVLGTPVLNRSNYKEKQMLGMFVSTMPLRVKFEENKNFLELAKEISTNTLTLFRHQKYPYSKTLEYVHANTDIKSNLYRIVLSYQNARATIENKEKYSTSWSFCSNIQDDLQIHITDMNDSGILNINYDYLIDLFSEEEINYLHTRIMAIIQNALKNTEVTVEDIAIMSEQEKNKILYEFNDTEADYPSDKTVIELFEEIANKYPENEAVTYIEDNVSYKVLNEKANQLAHYLKDNCAVKPNDVVSIVIGKGINQIISILAAMKLGATYLPILESWPDERVCYILKDSNSKVLIVDSKNNNRVEFNNIVNIDTSNYEMSSSENLNSKLDVNSIIYMIYTSGSTGQPKGTKIYNYNVVRLLFNDKNIFNFSHTDVWTMFHSYTFDFSVWEMYGALLYGGKLVIVPEDIAKDPMLFLNLLRDKKVTILNQTPAYFYKVVEAEKEIDNYNIMLRYVIFGGEALSPKLLKEFKKKYPNIKLVNMYGITETTVHVTHKTITEYEIDNNISNIGVPIPTLKLYILDKKNRNLPIFTEGELCVSGLGVGGGYLNKPELTSQKFIDNPIVEDKYRKVYKSGDIGKWLSNGEVVYCGRNDNQVKVRGFRIEIEEIEKKMQLIDGIEKVIVMAIDSIDKTKTLISFFTTSKDIGSIELKEELIKLLPMYMIPKLINVREFPLTSNGKIDRKTLIEEYEKSKHMNSDIVEELTENEKIIKNIIETTLNINIGNKNDNILDYGIDSLQVLDLSFNFTKFGLNIAPQKIYDIPTIKNLADIKNDDEMLKSDFELNNSIISNKQKNQFLNNRFKYNMNSILLTGATGFVGIHVLKELLDNNEVKKIYCLVREKEETGLLRLKSRFKEYYETDLPEDGKVEVIQGDFTNNNLGMDDTEFEKLINSINTVIHVGANVKHYSRYYILNRDNVVATENIIKICKASNASLAFISTTSILGFSKNDGTQMAYNENVIFENQEFCNHAYIKSKFIAENILISKCLENNINARIFRLGNIMPRYTDFKFQVNGNENSFINRIDLIVDTKIAPESLLYKKVELTPVDLCTKAIITLITKDSSQNIYHIHGDEISVKDILGNLNAKYKVYKDIEFVNEVFKTESKYKVYILEYINGNKFVENVAKNDITNSILSDNNFNWPDFSKEYIRNLPILKRGE